MFFMKEKGLTPKMSEDDDWSRPLTEAEAITADIPEGRVAFAAPDGAAHDQGMDPRRCDPFR